MKKIIIIALCICSLTGAYARSASIDTAAWKASIKLTLAQQLMHGSLDGQKQYKDILDSIDKAKEIESINAILRKNDLTKNADVCGVIIGLQIDDLSDDSINHKSIEAFVDTVMALNKTMKEYTKNRKEKYTILRQTIIQSLTKVKKPKVKNNVRSNEQPSDISQEMDLAWLWKSIRIAVFVLLLLLAVGGYVYLWLQAKHRKEHIIILQDNLRNTERDLEKKREQFNSLQQDLTAAKTEIKELKEKLQASQRRDDEPPITLNIVPSAPIEPTEPVLEDKVIYVGLPDNGIFGATYDSYRPGKTIYRITDHRKGTGDLEFVCQADAINIAKNSKTMFLQPACIIENDIDVFSGITTIKKGIVRYENDQWTIVEKAVIRLS